MEEKAENAGEPQKQMEKEEIGDTIKYTKERFLDEGTEGQVFLVKRNEDNKPFVAKYCKQKDPKSLYTPEKERDKLKN